MLSIIFLLKQFEHIQTLEGHHSSILALCISRNGQFVFTGSSDKSIRIWERTNEPLFIEEEREHELEKLFEKEEIRKENEVNVF